MTLFRILRLGFTLLLLSSMALGSKNDAAASALIEQARQLSDIRAEGAPPFRLQMDFKVIGGDGAARQGVYTEVWVSKAQWRKETAVGDFRRTQVAVGRKRWLFDSSTVIPERTGEIPALSEFGKFPGKWKSSKDREVNGVTVRCLERENDLGFSVTKSALCFDKTKGTLAIEFRPWVRGSRVGERVCSYSHYQKFGDRLFATSYECYDDKHPTLQARIVELAAAPSTDSTLFEKPEGAKESVNCLDSIEPPKQLYAPEPRSPESFSGTILVFVSSVIGTDGKPHNLAVTSEPRRAFDDAALEAVRQWRFKPASCGGEPMEAEIVVQIDFHRY
jgi:TonB family protein